MKGWAGETILQPSLCAGTVADNSVQGPQYCLLCQLLCKSGSTPHFFPHNNLYQSNIVLSSLLWSPALTVIRLFHLFLPCFHLSFCLYISFTHWVLLGINASPRSSSKCYYIVRLKLFLMLQWNPIYTDEIFCVCLSTLDTDQTTAIKLDLSHCILGQISECFLNVCVP